MSALAEPLRDEDGDPRVVFHGTRAGIIERFRPNFRRGEQMGFGIHFAYEKSFAQQYAQNPRVARRGSSPVIMAATVSTRNPLTADRIVYDDSQDFELALALAGNRMMYPRDEFGRRGVYLQTALDGSSVQRAMKLIEAAGYDAVIYQANISSVTAYGLSKGLGCRCITVFEPDQVLRAWPVPGVRPTPRKLPESLSEGLSR